MASTAEIRKTYTDFAKTLTGPKPFYAVAGVGDLAVEKVKNFRTDLTAEDNGVKDRATKLPKTVADKITDLPKEARKFGDKLTDAVDEQVKAADERYEKLAKRGEDIVKRVRTQKSTKDLVAQAEATFALGKGAVTTVRKSATDIQRSAKATLTTGRKEAAQAVDVIADSIVEEAGTASTTVKQSATRTRTAAKRTATTTKKAAAKSTSATKGVSTSARKTAAATKKAGTVAATKVGA